MHKQRRNEVTWLGLVMIPRTMCDDSRLIRAMINYGMTFVHCVTF
jgi:hypothetical protein